MNAAQLRQYGMLVRVRDFGRALAHRFPANSLAGQTFAAIAAVVEQLNGHTVAKLSAVQWTRAKAKARTALLDRVTAIAQTGRVIAEQTPGVPGLDDKFIVPVDVGDQALLMTARVLASEAEPLEDHFVAHLMPATFLADLGEAIATFERAIQGGEAGKDERIAANSRIKTTLAEGLAAARALDAMVRNQLRGEPTTMAMWRRDRRIRSGRGRGGAEAEAAQATAATPAVPLASAAPSGGATSVSSASDATSSSQPAPSSEAVAQKEVA